MLYVNVVHGGTCKSDRELTYPWKPVEDAAADPDTADVAWPRPSGGGWFECSDGTKIRGLEQAVEHEQSLP